MPTRQNRLSVLLIALLAGVSSAGQQWDMATSQSETDNPFGPFSLHRASDEQIMVVTNDVMWFP